MINVLVIPHAGGMASTYYPLKKIEQNMFNFIFLELPGRGRRFKENLVYNMEDVVEDLFAQIRGIITEGPYVLLGHSMGSWVAYELYYKILSENAPVPMHIFFSSNRSPYYKPDWTIAHDTDENFIRHILQYGQTSEDVFNKPLLRKRFLPILRADYLVMDGYFPKEKNQKMDVNISILGGDNDMLISTGFNEWKELTNGRCDDKIFPGGHFYILSKANEVVDYMVDEMIFEIA
ncbi:Surfactin synthase thioesterase subunit [Pseudobutyrivibrio sp. UC1225]|uniref:thioesterase II family protein n=1 Tax=Pseudobutyrivibrio sp. UC1225 TaxID=1798185 RepID=UPI0008F07514|nr:alpha/beta fold hydrolase [Pseudobutyrivibrio sp. UC1225]SFO35961.1 Surfactin synthase thioesterase subunit [Pseudobutyrivibrio sp. UC1225]